METNATIGKLAATRRTTFGKGAARKMRAQGKVPAVCYGSGQPGIPLTIDPEALRGALDPAKKENTLIELTIDDNGQVETVQVMLKDYHLDPIKRTLIHADFLQVSDKKTVEVSVPLTVLGRAKGLKVGGVLHQVMRELPIQCLPSQIPADISVDITELDLNDFLQLKDLALPEGVTVMLPEEQTLVQVMAPRAVEEEEEEEEGEGEEGEGAEGAEGEASEKSGE